MRRVATALALASLLTFVRPAQAGADNPIVTYVYTADPSALVVGDTLYLYTGHDEAPAGGGNFVMRDWHVFSSTDALNWRSHGPRLSVSTFSWAGADAWAGEVEPRNGRYYWYVPVNGNGPGWMDIGVAVGDSPTGPFTDARGTPLISDSTPGSASLNIDPTVFVDDDGQTYMYWGSFWQPRVVRLNANMTTLNGSVSTPQGLTDFWEAPWMFKRNGVYYMAYASNAGAGCVTSSSFACIRYATAGNPMGPWTHRGIVLGQVTSTTNHPAIVQHRGQWYMIYHTADAPGGGNFRRSVAIDRLTFNADGTMQRVAQTRGSGLAWSGTGFVLDGVDDFATVPTAAVQGLADFTVSAWVRLDTVTTWSRVFDFGRGTAANMFLTPRSSAGTARFAITSGGGGAEQRINAGSAFPAGVRTHVAVSVYGSTGILYVNGVEAGRSTSLTLRPSDLGTLTQTWIGRSQYPADPYLDGQVDDFRIHRRALTPTEIRTLAGS
jgi:glycosyl hydrolase family 43/concanavalin A-like lectin/glucanase superfamily protein